MDYKKIINNLDEYELGELQSIIRRIYKNKREKRISEIIEEHKEYIGKCYKCLINRSPDRYRYIKIVKAESENEFWVCCLVFENPIQYSFNPYYFRSEEPGDRFFGYIEYDGIRIENISFFTDNGRNGYREISLEEFNKALDDHVKDLKTLDWS